MRGERGALSYSKRGPNTTGWLGTNKNILAKDPTICSCEYREAGEMTEGGGLWHIGLSWSSLWGHESV